MGALGLILAISAGANSAEMVWDGGDGLWYSNSWNGGGATPNMNGTDSAVINDGTVTYVPGGDLVTLPGSNLTINSGGEWTQTTSNWARINGGLTLDGGTLSRTAGGNLAFGSDNTGANTTIDIGVTGGGSLNHNGELWFGWHNNATPSNLTVNMTINDGTVSALGGGGASWWIWDDDVAGIDYNINFKGPGEIILGAAGIRPESAGGKVDFETLWDMGILQARGESGLTGASFAEFFETTGTPNDNGYTLTSLVTVPEPSTLALACFGLLGLCAHMIRRKK